MTTQPEPRASLAVRLQIYSGRPDPEWTLDPEAAGEVARRIRQATSGEGIHAPPEGGLGYRGFRIAGGQGIGLPSEVIVFRRVVSDVSEKRGRHWFDAAGVERFLLEDARRRGFAELLDAGGAPRAETT